MNIILGDKIMFFLIIGIVLLALIIIMLSVTYRIKIFNQITTEMINGEIDVNDVDFTICDISRL